MTTSARCACLGWVAWRGLGYGTGITVLMIVTFLATYYGVGWWVVWR